MFKPQRSPWPYFLNWPCSLSKIFQTFNERLGKGVLATKMRPLKSRVWCFSALLCSPRSRQWQLGKVRRASSAWPKRISWSDFCFYDATYNRYPWYPVEFLRRIDTFDMSKHWSALNFRFVSTGSVTAQVCTSMVLQLGMLTDVVIWRSARHHYRLRHAKDSRLIDLRTCETWISVSWPNMEPHICSWSWLQETYEKKHVYLYIYIYIHV